VFHKVPREQHALAPNAAAKRAFPFRCQSFLRVILQQLSVALQLPFRGDVSLLIRCRRQRAFMMAIEASLEG
jgi:hypothetical protein